MEFDVKFYNLEVTGVYHLIIQNIAYVFHHLVYLYLTWINYSFYC